MGRLGAVIGSGALALALAGTLAGCGGGTSKADPTPTAPVSPSTTPIPRGYPSDAPAGLPYTEPGADLSLGEAATLGWRPPVAGAVPAPAVTLSSTPTPTPTLGADVPATGTSSSSPSSSTSTSSASPASPATAVRVTVTAIQPTTYAKSFRDWKVSQALTTSSPYFVKATITNLGTTDLGGLTVPLYGETAADTLVEPSTFAATFKPCAPNTFPKKFAPRKKTEVCLVYLVPDGGTLTGVTFRPSIDFEPIRWLTPAALVPSAPAGTIGATPTPSATMKE